MFAGVFIILADESFTTIFVFCTLPAFISVTDFVLFFTAVNVFCAFIIYAEMRLKKPEIVEIDIKRDLRAVGRHKTIDKSE